MELANLGRARATLGHASTSASLHDNKEIHTVNACARVVLETKIDVLHNTEAKVASVAKVALAQLVLLHFQAALEDLLGLLAAHSHMARNLLVSPDAESAHSVASCEEGVLSGTQLTGGGKGGGVGCEAWV